MIYKLGTTGIKFFILFTVLLSLISPFTTFADDTNAPQGHITLFDPFGCGAGTESSPCFVQVLQGVIGRLLVVIYPILAGMVFYGGLQMMLARGDIEKYKRGLKTIQYAVIGFVVILFAQGVGLILHDLLSLR